MTRTATKFAAALALISTGELQAAQAAAAANCLNRAELRGLMGYMMPSVVSLLIVRCKPGLPAGAYLATQGQQLVNQLEAGRKDSWPMAKQAFAKLAGEDPKVATMLDAMPESMLRPVLEDKLADKLVSEIKSQDCKDIDRVMGTLAPLPPGNLVDFATELAILGSRDKKELNVCAS